MTLLYTFALSAALAAPAHPVAELGPDSGSVAFTTARVWLRSSPTLNSKRVTLLPRGAQVRILWCRAQACNVEFRRLQGYVRRELLRRAPDKRALEPADALALLQSEHHFSMEIHLLEDPATPNR